jgi:hypothetical protein
VSRRTDGCETETLVRTRVISTDLSVSSLCMHLCGTGPPLMRSAPDTETPAAGPTMTKRAIVGLSLAPAASQADGTAVVAFVDARASGTVANSRPGQALAPRACPPSRKDGATTGPVGPVEARSMSRPGEKSATCGSAVVVTRTSTRDETVRGHLRTGMSPAQKVSRRADGARSRRQPVRRPVALPPPRQRSPGEIAKGDAGTRTAARVGAWNGPSHSSATRRWHAGRAEP